MSDIHHGSISPGPGRAPIAYSQCGRGPDVVLIHGALVTRTDMVMALSEALSEHYQVTAFDRPGQGDSGPQVGGTTWEQARSLKCAADVLGLREPVIVGHSIGGAVAVAWAQQYPREIRGAVALAPICFPELRLEHLLFGPRATPVVGPLLAHGLSGTVDTVLLPTLWRAMFLPQAQPSRFTDALPFEQVARPRGTKANGEDAAWLNAGLARTVFEARRCEAAVTILAGDRDAVVNNHLHGALLARLLPRGRYVQLEGLGHMIHHFAQARIRDAVDEQMAA